jgi:hypothetical protein
MCPLFTFKPPPSPMPSEVDIKKCGCEYLGSSNVKKFWARFLCWVKLEEKGCT